MEREVLEFFEDRYRVTWRPTRSELQRAHALRADVFCRELGWVGSRSDPLERDEFDEGSIAIVVVDPVGEVAATVRLVADDRPWMIDGVFRRLMPPGPIRRSGAMEASRLAVAERARAVRLASGRRVCDLVFKAAYVVCALRRARHVYMVTSDVVARLLRSSGLPCEALAPCTPMPDGVRAVPVLLDWGRLDDGGATLRWFEAGLHGALVERVRTRSVARARASCDVPDRSSVAPARPPCPVGQ